jgi:hypothetical protein
MPNDEGQKKNEANLSGARSTDAKWRWPKAIQEKLRPAKVRLHFNRRSATNSPKNIHPWVETG